MRLPAAGREVGKASQHRLTAEPMIAKALRERDLGGRPFDAGRDPARHTHRRTPASSRPLASCLGLATAFVYGLLAGGCSHQGSRTPDDARGLAAPLPTSSSTSEPARASRAPDSSVQTPDGDPFLRAPGDIVPPRVLSRSSGPELSELLLDRATYQVGQCIVQTVVATDGSLTLARIYRPRKPTPELTSALRAVLGQWKMAPATRQGQPVAVYFAFVLSDCPVPVEERSAPAMLPR